MFNPGGRRRPTDSFNQSGTSLAFYRESGCHL